MTACWPPSVGERRLWLFLQLSIQVHIDLFVVKAQQPGYPRAFVRREPVVPHQVIMLLPVNNNVVVLGVSLVGASRHEVALSKNRLIHGTSRQVVPCWQARLEQVDGVGRLGYRLAPDLDFDWTR